MIWGMCSIVITVFIVLSMTIHIYSPWSFEIFFVLSVVHSLFMICWTAFLEREKRK